MTRPTLSVALAAALGCVFLLASDAVAESAAFTYQGQLKENGQPYNGTADLMFATYDAEVGGFQYGTQSLSNVAVTDGLFTVVLNRNYELHTRSGPRLWLEVTVNGTTLAQRQELTPAPYALNLRPGALVANHASIGASISLWAANTQEAAFVSNPIGLAGQSYTGDFFGLVFMSAPVGVFGESDTGYGVVGRNAQTYNRGILGHPSVGAYGDNFNSGHYGGFGSATAGAYGAYGPTGTTGYLGINDVGAYGQNANGVYGGLASSDTGAYGVYGSRFGYLGRGDTGVLGSGPAGTWGGYFYGNLGASGTKSFRIDHPLDPENKFLLHYCSEGPEPLNVYSGTVVTDADGGAWVDLPDYFEEINRDFRYTLTVVDDSDSADFVQAQVARKIRDNRFKIRTSRPHTEVSWEVKGVRNDVYLRQHGAPVVVEKSAQERGKFQHPELYGRSAADALQPPPQPTDAAPVRVTDDFDPSALDHVSLPK